MSPRMRKLIRSVSIKIPSSNVLRIPGLIREFKHSNSNMRHWRLTSAGSLFWDTLYEHTPSQLTFYRSFGPNVDTTNSLGVSRYFSKVSSNFNLEISLVDLTDTENLRKAIKSNTKVILSAPTCCVIVKYIGGGLGLSHISNV